MSIKKLFVPLQPIKNVILMYKNFHISSSHKGRKGLKESIPLFSICENYSTLLYSTLLYISPYILKNFFKNFPSPILHIVKVAPSFAGQELQYVKVIPNFAGREFQHVKVAQNFAGQELQHVKVAQNFAA
ncbi:MAG: hypothetical protein LBR17_03485 [Bacteroidales bacterium]|nr:hypothetical protein [Bacteroidales bacterium]